MKKSVTLVAIILVVTIVIVSLSSASLRPFKGESPWVISVIKSVPVDENGEITTHNRAAEFVQIDITDAFKTYTLEQMLPLMQVDLLSEQMPYSTDEYFGYWIHGAYNHHSRSDETFDILICDIPYFCLDNRGQQVRNHKAWKQLMKALEGETSPYLVPGDSPIG